ncbi:hypothetical protein B0J11DRAFT_510269 [Dendryphion nanum]|uniref:Uncharacterized protein n=1 Tax=Dendryphion nanum TaxID=256645 RepID=A0A9P9IDW9_9PLEO|nr:hypothetical protein B0J11DRAFT_510269 [Dendryphion nanum]
MRHLAAVAQQDLERAQIYAKFVKILRFRQELIEDDASFEESSEVNTVEETSIPEPSTEHGDEEELGEDDDSCEVSDSEDSIDWGPGPLGSGEYKYEGRWHNDLVKLSFSRLEELAFWDTEDSGSYNTEDFVSQYLQPSIKALYLSGVGPLSDTFLDAVSQTCPNIGVFTIRQEEGSNITSTGLTNFLSKSNSLITLEIEGLDDALTNEGLVSVASYQNLEVLHVTEMKDSWISAMGNMDRSFTSFPKLRYLHAAITDTNLERLSQFAPKITALTLKEDRLQHPTSRILSAASKFLNLEAFEVHFSPEDQIRGAELLNLVQDLPELVRVNIYGSHAEGITDELMDQVAQKIPEILEFSLQPDVLKTLTFKTFKSLGQHCKQLGTLRLHCNIDWEEDGKDIDTILFPELTSLNITSTPGIGPRLRESITRDRLVEAATRFRAYAPRLQLFTITHDSEAEETFDEIVGDLLYE